MNTEAANRIEELCKKRAISVSKLLKDCNLNASIVTDMKNKGIVPSVDKIIKISRYLDVSAEYIVTGQEARNSIVNTGEISISGVQANEFHSIEENLALEEKELIKIFRSLDFKRRLYLLNKAVELENDEKAVQQDG